MPIHSSPDPANIPLPPSPEIQPFILTGTSTPDLPATGSATPTGLSLFNTPRNPLPTSPSTALSVQRPRTPSPLPSPVVEATDLAGEGKEGGVDGGKVEDGEVPVVTLDDAAEIREGVGLSAETATEERGADVKSIEDVAGDSQSGPSLPLVISQSR
jgi:hypothetical protein